MSTYFNNPEELKKLNNLIDNDTTIEKNIFKKQLINNYSDYKNDIITYTETNDYTVDTFYVFLKRFLLKKNEFVGIVNNYNLVDKVGLENSTDVEKQLDKQKELNNKLAKMSQMERIEYQCENIFKFTKNSVKFKDCTLKVYVAEAEAQRIDLEKQLVLAKLQIEKTKELNSHQKAAAKKRGWSGNNNSYKKYKEYGNKMNYTHNNRTKNKFKTQKLKNNIQNLEKQLNSSSSGGKQKRRSMKKRKSKI